MNKFLATAAIVFAGTSVSAEDGAMDPYVGISGEVETVVAETAGDKYGATTSLDLNLNVYSTGTARMNFVVDATSKEIKLDEWAIGVPLGMVNLSFGDQGNIFVEGETGVTLEEPDMGTSISAEAMDVKIAIGFSDITADVTDVENIQGSYNSAFGIIGVTSSGDYNLGSKDWILGNRIDADLDSVAVGVTTTYGSAYKTFAFEVDATAYGITAYVAGDQDDFAQNVGASYEYYLTSNLQINAGADYNIDSEELKPEFGVLFNF